MTADHGCLGGLLRLEEAKVMVRRILFGAAPMAIVALVCCSSTEESAPAAFPAGSPMTTEAVRFQLAVYYLPVPVRDPVAVLESTVLREHPGLEIPEEKPEAPPGLTVSADIVEDVPAGYAPPDLDSLQYFGHGLSREQAQALQQSTSALVLDFTHPSARVWEGLRTANELVEAIARETGGLVWDEGTREVFTPDAWHEERLASWTGTVPDVSTQITIHAYKKEEYVRAITLGMQKLGLPDVVVDGFSWSLSRTMGHLVNLLGQAMAEGAVFGPGGEYELDIHAIQDPAVRDPQIESLLEDATARARLVLRKGTWEEGDPLNRLIEIGFDAYPGPDVHARQAALLSSLFGAQDSITRIAHTDELLAASERVRARLPALRADFLAGLAPGELIQVKAPFPVPEGGNEWMWVEVTAWEGGTIRGLLKNEPFDIPDLHAGQVVEVDEDDVFDYIRRRPDGSEEGNETAEIIAKMSSEDAP